MLTIKFLPSAQVSQINSKLYQSAWLSNSPHKLNLSKSKLLISSLRFALHTTFPISAYGNSIIQVAQAKTLTLSLDLLFVSPLYFHIQSVVRSYWLYFQMPYQKANYLLLPPLLPLWTKVQLSLNWVMQRTSYSPPALTIALTPPPHPHLLSAQQLEESF